MSRTAVQNYIRAQVATIQVGTDSAVAVSTGRPEPEIPATDIPLCVIELGQPQSEQLTFDDANHNGVRHDTYEVTLTVYLGVPTSPRKKVETRQLEYAKAFLDVFAPDYTLGGNVWMCRWQPPTDNIRDGIYKLLGEEPSVTFRLRVTEETNMRGSVDLPVPESALVRAFNAAVLTGWRELGELPYTGHWFREADLLYNATDGYYYLFGTEFGGGVVPPGGPFTVSTWNIVGTLGTLNFGSAHNIPVGEWCVVVVAGTTSRLNGAKIAFATSTTQVTYACSATGGDINGSGGTMTHTSQTGQAGVRRATTLEGLVSAVANTDYFSRVVSALWYPTVVYIAPSTWYVFGANSSGGIGRKVFTGAYPNGKDVFTGSAASLTSLGSQAGDPCVRPHPTDGFYYMVVTDGTANPVTTRVYKIAAANIATDGWSQVCANVWADIGLPPYFAFGVVDPSLAFVDGRVFLTFAGSPTGAAGTYGNAIVELDPVTFKAMGLVAQLQTPTTYESWQGGTVLGDPMFLRCPDGVDRVFGYTNNLTYDGTGKGTWGCLDLAS